MAEMAVQAMSLRLAPMLLLLHSSCFELRNSAFARGWARMLTPWQRYGCECETSTQRYTPDVLLLSLLMVDVVQFKPPLALVYQARRQTCDSLIGLCQCTVYRQISGLAVTIIQRQVVVIG